MNGFKKALALLAALSLSFAFISGCADVTDPQSAGTSNGGYTSTAEAASGSRDTSRGATETAAETQPAPDTTEGGSDTSDAVPVSEEQTEITTDTAGESETEPTPDTSSEAPDTSSEAPDTSSEAPDTSTDAPETSDTTPAGTEPPDTSAAPSGDVVTDPTPGTTPEEPETSSSETSVTDPPETDPPATNPPATDPPATNPPATNPPATDPPVTDPPVTAPPATNPPATDPPVTAPPVPARPSSFVKNLPDDVLFTTSHPGSFSSVSVSTAKSVFSLNGWAGNQYFLDGTVKYTWFLRYDGPVWITDVYLQALSQPSLSILNTVSVCVSDNGQNWTLVPDSASLSNGFFRFHLSEAVTAGYVMLYMAEPSAEIYAHWNSKDGFYSVYDPSPYIAPVENPIKIYVDQGHNFAGYHNSGAQGNGLDEGAVTYEIGIRLAALLENDPRFEVRLSRPTKSTVLGTDNSSSLRARSSGANSWGADYFVSIHCNSASAASAHGTEVYSYDSPSDGSRLAASILSSLCSATGLSSRGTKVNPELAVLRQTTMTAVLVETGFVSNASDAALLSSNPGLFAQGIYNGIVAFCFG